MAFIWNPGWDSADNNNGSSQATIIATLTNVGHADGDAGLLAALAAQSGTVTVVKGIHPKPDHITLWYLGGTWHARVIGTATGALRVADVTQRKN